MKRLRNKLSSAIKAYRAYRRDRGVPRPGYEDWEDRAAAHS
jgi:hypothetical protein